MRKLFYRTPAVIYLCLVVPGSFILGQCPAVDGGSPSINFQSPLPNGRCLTPAGDWLALAPYPFALAIRPDGEQLAIASIGWPFSLNIVVDPGKPSARIVRIPDSTKGDSDVQVHAGLAYSKDGRTLYDATGDTGAVDVRSTETWRRIRRISLDGVLAGASYSESFAANLVLSHDGRTLFVLDQGNWRVVVIDVASSRPIASVRTGSNPFAMTLSGDGQMLHVTNSGLFEYKLVGSVKQNDILRTALRFPPFGYPSKRARQGVLVEGHKIPGLGQESDVRGSSLWTYAVKDPAKPTIIAKLRLGARIRSGPESVIGGASPSGVIADSQHIYATLAHSDSVTIITPDGKQIQQEMFLTPFSGPAFKDSKGRQLRGIMPVGISQDAARLFVTEVGINAVAVIDKQTGEVQSQLPVGWYPSVDAVSPDGANLYVVNSKGKGAGPNGGSMFPADAAGRYIGELEFGSLSTIRLGARDINTNRFTAAVIRNNQAALVEGSSLPHIKHVFFVIRENRTFDEVFGDLAGANGDPALARYGVSGWVEEDRYLKNVRITPNAHALAARFSTSDSFYADSDVSADGHRWALGAAPTPWMNLAWTSNYGGRRHANPFSSAPGRRALGGGADAPMPEDEPEFGLLWEHVSGSGLSLRNYGEGLEVEGSDEGDGEAPEGQRLLLNAPIPAPVFRSTDRHYPTFNLGIPDQARYKEFAEDFGRRLREGKAPALTVIRLPNDHTTDPRPGDGYPYRASYVADNDLALGKIVEWISHSSVWSDSAIFVIEDDAQSGVDHVDAHRSVLLVMSPYARKGFISHRHVSMPSVQKTMYELLGLGPLSLEDALAADLSDMFTTSPDPASFNAEAVDPRIFDPTRARLAHPKTKAELKKLRDCDDSREIASEFQKRQKRMSTGTD